MSQEGSLKVHDKVKILTKHEVTKALLKATGLREFQLMPGRAFLSLDHILMAVYDKLENDNFWNSP